MAGAINAIEEMPTFIDLVRCRDCTLWRQHPLFKEIGYCSSVFKGEGNICTPGSFFCADGKRKMDAEVQVRGNNLSGGQKQRLLIARALAANPEILVLDDASSALDYRTDAALRRALRENYRDTTTVLIAQRISSLRHADLILVLDDGAVIGAGDHAHLMETCEEYAYLARIQMGDGEEAV